MMNRLTTILLIAALSTPGAFAAGKKSAKEQPAAQGQQQSSAYREDQIARKKAILKFKTVFVEGGSFTMGCTAEQEDECFPPEKPAHPVFVRSFAICKYCVTQRQWREVMGKNPSDVRDEDFPVTNISWDDAQKFIAKLNNFMGTSYRLPTEAEWEFAARGGIYSESKKYSGSEECRMVAWYKDNAGELRPNGKRKGNEIGLFDMSGNVWEWCSDWYGPYPTDTETEQINPEGASEGKERVVRGGYFEGPAIFCRVSCRNKSEPSYASSIIGLRLATDFTDDAEKPSEMEP
ncbi:MAG: formylglycine-generating enzyme family protein [Paludibacteraceae bacterium]|nr:formylglycine-generating enzyme family protein [Paludibacteraceae bacterium]